MAFWKCCGYGRSIGDDEYTSRGKTKNEHVYIDCFWKAMDESVEVA